MSRLPSLADSWVLAGDINRHSERTLTAKRDLLEKPVWFMNHKGLNECGTHELRQFLHYVTHGHEDAAGRWGNARNRRPTKARTVKNYHGILRAFFNWLVAEGEIDAPSPMDRITPPIDRPDEIQPFTREQLKKLLLAAKRTLHPRRDEAILLLLLDTGMRASELSALRVGDVDLQGATVTVEGKGARPGTSRSPATPSGRCFST